jgi:hypothetical protein
MEERAEDLIIAYLETLPSADLKSIDSADRIQSALNYDVEEEIQAELWRLFLYNMNYRRILEKLEEVLVERNDEEEEEEEENEEDKENEENE